MNDKGLRVLVVDDEKKILQLARDYLEHAGFAVLTTENGATGRMRTTIIVRMPRLAIRRLSWFMREPTRRCTVARPSQRPAP